MYVKALHCRLKRVFLSFFLFVSGGRLLLCRCTSSVAADVRRWAYQRALKRGRRVFYVRSGTRGTPKGWNWQVPLVVQSSPVSRKNKSMGYRTQDLVFAWNLDQDWFDSALIHPWQSSHSCRALSSLEWGLRQLRCPCYLPLLDLGATSWTDLQIPAYCGWTLFASNRDNSTACSKVDNTNTSSILKDSKWVTSGSDLLLQHPGGSSVGIEKMPDWLITLMFF